MTNKASLRDLVAALRSGKYQKGRAALKSRARGAAQFSYCCEGVMCEISGIPETLKGTNEFGVEIIGFRADSGPDVLTAFAPASVWEGTGIQTQPSRDIALIELPNYYVDEIKIIDGKKVFSLYGGGWSTNSLASLNDYVGNEPRNTFTFDQIADLIEWAYLTD